MNSPPRPAFPTAPTGNAQELPPSPEDDLLAVRGPGLPPGLSPLTLPEAISTRDISPDPIPLTPLVESGSLHPSVQIQEPLSHEHRLQASQSTSPNAASLEPARHSPSPPPPPPPDELIYTMSQYQPVSAGSSANSRAMSQVSPGFIFVNFLSQSVCCFSPPAFILPGVPVHWYCLYHVSYLMSPLSPELTVRALNLSLGPPLTSILERQRPTHTFSADAQSEHHH
jgi:hypothetical protein